MPFAAHARTLDEGSDPVVEIRSELDIAAARAVARELCKDEGLRGFGAQKIITAVSELARNIALYAGQGRITMRVPAPRTIVIVAQDWGPGIADLDVILAGEYRSKTGLGRGLLGVRRLASRFEIETGETGTRVELEF